MFAASLLILAATVAAPTPARALDPERVRWSRLDFKATKFIFTATAEVTLETVPSAQAESDLIAIDQAPPLEPSGPQTVVVELESRYFGHGDRHTIWLEPRDGSALQRVEVDEKRHRYKMHRYTRRGNYETAVSPASRDEEKLPRTSWSDTSEEWHAYPETFDGSAVIEPGALFYLISVAKLEQPGDRLTFVTFTRDTLARVEIEVLGVEDLKVDYVEESPQGEELHQGTVPTLHLGLRARKLDALDEEADMAFLGLEGDLDLHLEQENRVPLQVSGRVPPLGRVRVKLARVVMR